MTCRHTEKHFETTIPPRYQCYQMCMFSKIGAYQRRQNLLVEQCSTSPQSIAEFPLVTLNLIWRVLSAFTSSGQSIRVQIGYGMQVVDGHGPIRARTVELCKLWLGAFPPASASTSTSTFLRPTTYNCFTFKQYSYIRYSKKILFSWSIFDGYSLLMIT